ncbi:MAG: T9SS type A sorting domain-containing protein [Chitinophagaceae bacterium]|nr:T9SS type A sorting domain-containing protein [Chitinophagaceae bacterium]
MKTTWIKLILVTFCCTGIFNTLLAQEWYTGPSSPTHLAPVPNLVQGATGGDYTTKDIGVDKDGNVYVVGEYTGTFGNTASVNGSYDGFIAKFSATGTLLYVSTVATIADDRLTGIAVDINGNAYFTGYFNDFTVTIKRVFPTVAGNTVTMAPSGGGGLAGITHGVFGRLNPTGTVAWAQQVTTYNSPTCGASNYSEGIDVAIDESFTIPIAVFGGITTSNTIFAKGLPNNTCNASNNITAINPHPDYVIPMGYTVAYNNCGKLLWAKVIQPITSNSAQSEVRGVSVRRSNVYPNQNGVFITGSYYGGNIFPGNPNITMNTSGQKGFVARLNVNTGNVEWVDDIAGDYVTGKAISLATDGGDIQPVVAGDFYSTSTLSFNNGVTANAVSYNYEVFVAKYSYGGACQWARAAGGTYDDEVNGITCSKTSMGEIYITGSYVNNFNFGGVGLANTYGSFNTLNHHLYLAKLDSWGNTFWADDLHGDCSAEYSIGENVCVNGAGVARPYVTGLIGNTYLNYPKPGYEINLLPNSGTQCGFYAAHYNDVCTNTPYMNFNVNRMPGSTSATISFTAGMIGPMQIFYRPKMQTVYPDPKCYDPTPWNTTLYNVSSPGPKTVTISGLMPSSIYEWGVIGMGVCGTENNTMPISGMQIETTILAKQNENDLSALNETETSVVCYPNPFQEELNISIEGQVTENSSFHLYNSIGQVMIKTEFVKGQNQYTMSTSHLASGSYFYVVYVNGQRKQSGVLHK